jgi:hypothetical protein
MDKKRFERLPLPASSSKEDLETISRNKFFSLFDPKLFEIRPVTFRDKGTDFVIELKQDGFYTNSHFIVQLKSTISIRPNKDGTISLSVSVSNINYLSNYHMPAYYILYDHKKDNWYIEDVDHVYHCLSQKLTIPPLKKNRFTINFSKLLTLQEIAKIYSSTLERAALLKGLNEHLNSPLLAERNKTAGIVIDENKEVYSVEHNIALIDQYGFQILNKGEFRTIIEIEKRTNPHAKVSATFSMVCGVAYLQTGKLYKAMELLKMAQLNAEGLRPDLKAMLVYSILNAKYLLGIISEHDFTIETAKIIQTKDAGSFLQLESAFRDFNNADIMLKDRIERLYKSIRNILAQEPDNNILRIVAYARVIAIEGMILKNDLTNYLTLVCGRTQNHSRIANYQAWLSKESEYSARLKQLLEIALKENMVQAFNNLALKEIEWSFQKIYISHVVYNWNTSILSVNESVNENDKRSLVIISNQIEPIEKLYESTNDKENLFNCLVVKYEIAQFAGQIEIAEGALRQIRELIETNDFDRLRSRYESLIAGNTRYQQFVNTLAERIETTKDLMKGRLFGDDIASDKFDESLARMERNYKWTIDHFLKFQFPQEAL